MTDYKAAFEEGLELARKVEMARKEIETIILEFKQQVSNLGGGKLAIEIKQFTRHRETMRPTFSHILGGEIEYYNAIVTFNPTVKSSPRYELADWEQSKVGYPCTISWRGQVRNCHDKESLERNFEQLLKDPIIGEKLLILLNLKPEVEKK